MSLPAVFEGGPFDGHEESLDHLPSTVVFDKMMTWPGSVMASDLPLDTTPPTARYRRKGVMHKGRHVYEYEPLEPV